MNTRQRNILVVVLILFISTLLSGCIGGENKVTPTPTETPPEQTVTEVPTETVTETPTPIGTTNQTNDTNSS